MNRGKLFYYLMMFVFIVGIMIVGGLSKVLYDKTMLDYAVSKVNECDEK